MSWGVYLFGSCARGDQETSSDRDILLVTDEENDPEFLASLKNNSEISRYSFSHLGDFYNSGNLFAWHLYNESIFLGGSDLLKKFGRPKDYSTFVVDICEHLFLFEDIKQSIEIRNSPKIYEAGLLYLVLRNFSHSFSWYENDKPVFSKYCPFMLTKMPNFPLTQQEYKALMNCRLASTRGISCDDISYEELESFIKTSESWLQNKIQSREEYNEICGTLAKRTKNFGNSK